MKKIFALILALLMIVSVFTACAGEIIITGGIITLSSGYGIYLNHEEAKLIFGDKDVDYSEETIVLSVSN